MAQMHYRLLKQLSEKKMQHNCEKNCDIISTWKNVAIRRHLFYPLNDSDGGTGFGWCLLFCAKGGEMCLKVYCDNKECDFNENQLCTRHKVYYVQRRCRSSREVTAERAANLMRSAYRPGCRKKGGKHVSTDARVL